MKKVLFLCLCLIIILFGLDNKPKEKANEKSPLFEEKGVFISYIDYSTLKGKNKNEMQIVISQMINNISYFGLNTIILQTSPFSDAIYPSEIYKSSHTVVHEEGDPLPLDILKYFIEKAKEKDIAVYAWINPYRIRNDNNIGDINKNTYYYKWLKTDNIEITDKGIFLNPASSEVLEYITKGLKELCQNYDIKGVIYDDYYYPNDTIDLKTYEKTNKKKNLKQYRIDNINKLIESSYDTVKGVNKDIKFGLSPSGNIEYNLDREYLDVKNVLKSNKIDMIIPQLYYGFSNQNKPYINTLNNWEELNKNTDLYVALSLYKSGMIDSYAGSGENEWLLNTDILKKQIIVSRNVNNYKGFFIFRYEYLFDIHDNHNLNKEVDNLKKLLNNSK
ncbi:MAG: family 10 glycosylhydrolase [Bacilli bacterium]|nr:family 10 glycosylhydrolase [Bacilli bacterium]